MLMLPPFLMLPFDAVAADNAAITVATVATTVSVAATIAAVVTTKSQDQLPSTIVLRHQKYCY